MPKQILVLSSSPRKGGNSDRLCDQFLQGAIASGHAAEKIRLSEKQIRYCTGCGACFSSSRCSQKDDMDEILDKMVRADVIVMATPVYFYAMAAQMKTLIDRTCARYRELSRKAFYFILTAADGNQKAVEETLTGFRAFLSCLDHPEEKQVIYGTGA